MHLNAKLVFSFIYFDPCLVTFESNLPFYSFVHATCYNACLQHALHIFITGWSHVGLDSIIKQAASSTEAAPKNAQQEPKDTSAVLLLLLRYTPSPHELQVHYEPQADDSTGPAVQPSELRTSQVAEPSNNLQTSSLATRTAQSLEQPGFYSNCSPSLCGLLWKLRPKSPPDQPLTSRGRIKNPK